MKCRLNITIDETLIEQAKNYAFSQNTSLSALIEDSLKKIIDVPKPKKQNALDILKLLPKPKSNTELYSSKKYLEENKNKYGF